MSAKDAHVTPWWCRKFGHAFVQRAAVRVNETRWEQPSSVPLSTYCRRCGRAPEPAAGPCTVTWACEGYRTSTCGLLHGHAGAHKDPDNGMIWWLTGDTIPTDVKGDSGASS